MTSLKNQLDPLPHSNPSLLGVGYMGPHLYLHPAGP